MSGKRKRLIDGDMLLDYLLSRVTGLAPGRTARAMEAPTLYQVVTAALATQPDQACHNCRHWIDGTAEADQGETYCNLKEDDKGDYLGTEGHQNHECWMWEASE